MADAKIFESNQFTKPKTSSFDLSREQKMSIRFGQLIPTYLEEILPGDQFKVSTEMLIRFAPMIAPIMHRINVTIHYFFVPNRIIWNQWEAFITGGQEGTTEPVFPTGTLDLNDNMRLIGSLGDYLGLPTNTVDYTNAGGQLYSLLPVRAYYKIFSDYYRDENLVEEFLPNSTSTNTYASTYGGYRGVMQRSWEKDYFTSALPFMQRGSAVGIPIELEYKSGAGQIIVPGNPSGTFDDLYVAATPSSTDGYLTDSTNTENYRVENLVSLDLSFTINELRTSSALQRWLEKQAIGGYRYIETILSHFGVRSDDARLQRSEYLGGGKIPLIISETLNTTGTSELPQGNMSGHGVSMGQSTSFKKYFKEHGYVMGILSVMPKPTYQGGIARHWTRRDRFDYYWPELAQLGEQPIYYRELKLSETDNNNIFGYQQRYAEYKYGISTVHGQFKNTLDFWHLGRKFSSVPALNNTFVQYPYSGGPSDRIFPVQIPDLEQIYVHLYHDVKARRLMPYFSNPRLM